MMREVLERRFARLEKPTIPIASTDEWPDLLLIDGGKGQVSAVFRTLQEELGIRGRAGGRHLEGAGPQRRARAFPFARRPRIRCCRSTRRRFSTSSGCATRRTASRSARTARKPRQVAWPTNPLDDVPGIGPARKKALLMHFGTARAVRGAALEDLERAPGVSKAMARAIYDHFHPRG